MVPVAAVLKFAAGVVRYIGTLNSLPKIKLPKVTWPQIRLPWGKRAPAASEADDFFAGTVYSKKVQRQMTSGDFHAFPRSVEAFQDAGKRTKITGGDGLVRDKLEIPGTYRGRDGVFEFIKEPDGKISHRLFVANR